MIDINKVYCIFIYFLEFILYRVFSRWISIFFVSVNAGHYWLLKINCRAIIWRKQEVNGNLKIIDLVEKKTVMTTWCLWNYLIKIFFTSTIQNSAKYNILHTIRETNQDMGMETSSIVHASSMPLTSFGGNSLALQLPSCVKSRPEIV